MSESPLNIYNKQQVSRSFSQSAKHYDAVAILQKEVGEKLLTWLPEKNYESAIDIGSGTGRITNMMWQKSRAKQCVGVDFAQGMLRTSQVLYPDLPVCLADACDLPFEDASCDLVFSNFTLQWCALDAAMQEIDRVLAPGGVFLMTTLATKTLSELREAWSYVDHYPHVNTFLSEETIKNIGSQYFENVKWQTTLHQIEFCRLLDLMRHLKSIGAQNRIISRKKGLMTPRTIEKLDTAYQALYANKHGGSYKGSFEVVYALWQKPIS